LHGNIVRLVNRPDLGGTRLVFESNGYPNASLFTCVARRGGSPSKAAGAGEEAVMKNGYVVKCSPDGRKIVRVDDCPTDIGKASFYKAIRIIGMPGQNSAAAIRRGPLRKRKAPARGAGAKSGFPSKSVGTWSSQRSRCNQDAEPLRVNDSQTTTHNEKPRPEEPGLSHVVCVVQVSAYSG
jgi:hypothetical protein